MNRQRGMTLVELMVSLAVVLLILGAATTAYLKLLRTYKTQGRLAESYMANLTGLELLRYDIEMAGFGLPASLAAGASYTEALAAGLQNAPAPPYDPAALLNDSASVPSGPRAFVLRSDVKGPNNSGVLAIKSIAANINSASKKWSMITLAPPPPLGAKPKVKKWGVTVLDPVMDFKTGDYFIVLNDNFQLQTGAANNWCFNFTDPDYYADASAIPSPNTQQVYYIYGLDNSAAAHRMPFNRVDYYLDKITADFPSSCAASTYTLYRSMIDQATGQLVKTPLIDCVEDFQVAFGLDTNADGNVDTWTDKLDTMSADTIRQQVREVRVFLLFQEGLADTSKSPDFRFTGTLNLGAGLVPGKDPLSSFTPSGADAQCRWKVIEMAIKPMNLK